MHDIDRVLLEAPGTAREEEDEQFLFEDEQFFEAEDEGFLEAEDEVGPQHEHSLNETQEMQLANEVLEVSSEQELEQFLGRLFTSAADAAGRFARSKTGRQLGGILKQAAAQAVPAIGDAIGAPAGAAAGGLGDVFGLEGEAVTGEDREFEAAKRYVRFADCAVHNALRRFNSAPPQQVARRAATLAARRHAPGLPLQRVLTSAPLRRLIATTALERPARRGPGATPPGMARGRSPVRSGASATTSRSALACRSCGAPVTATSGRWLLRGNGIVLLPD